MYPRFVITRSSGKPKKEKKQMSKKYGYGLVAVVIVAASIPSACGGGAAASNKVEVFSWWVGPGEADGLAAMSKIFQAQYPNDQVCECGRCWWCRHECRGRAGDPPARW